MHYCIASEVYLDRNTRDILYYRGYVIAVYTYGVDLLAQSTSKR